MWACVCGARCNVFFILIVAVMSKYKLLYANKEKHLINILFLQNLNGIGHERQNILTFFNRCSSLV